MKKKLNKKQIELIKPLWNKVDKAHDYLYKKIDEIEEEMQKLTGIEDLEIFINLEGTPTGIGNTSRTYALLHAHSWRYDFKGGQ